MSTCLLELLLCGSEDVDLLVLFCRVQFWAFGLLLEYDLFAGIFGYDEVDAFEVVVFKDSFINKSNYSAAVGRFRDEYLSMDSIRSIA